MKTPAAADIQRWSDEVARDPRSLAFLPLARAYRRQGLRELALQLCLRGLEAYPNHAEAHGLLAMLYLDAGDHQRAADEWSMVLRVDPDNFSALRGIGFCYLEQDQLSRARQALERAALLRPADPMVQEALRLLGTRQELVQSGTHGPTGDDPWAESTGTATAAAGDGRTDAGLVPAAPAAGVPAEAASVPRPSRPAETAAPVAGAPEGARPDQGAGTASRPLPPTLTRADAGAGGDLPADPALLFDELLESGPLLGALLVDAQGLVLAGRLAADVAGDAAVLGAVLGGAVDEAVRTAAHLHLGEWRGVLLEAGAAMLYLTPAPAAAVLVLAARPSTPAGWLLRAAVQGVARARRYAEVYG